MLRHSRFRYWEQKAQVYLHERKTYSWRVFLFFYPFRHSMKDRERPPKFKRTPWHCLPILQHNTKKKKKWQQEVPDLDSSLWRYNQWLCMQWQCPLLIMCNQSLWIWISRLIFFPWVGNEASKRRLLRIGWA